MPWQLIILLLLFFAILVGSFALKPVVVWRGIRSAQLLGIAAFCTFGFLASFEFPGVDYWKILYAASGLLSVAGATIPWLPKRTTTQPVITESHQA